MFSTWHHCMCCGGGCGFPETPGAEQAILLRCRRPKFGAAGDVFFTAGRENCIDSGF